MKWTVLAVALVNLGYFLWQASQPPAPVLQASLTHIAEEEAQAPSLVLVTAEMAAQLRDEQRRLEMAKEEPEKAKPKPAPKPKPKVVIVACHEVGPVKSVSAADKLAGRLKNLGIEVQRSERSGKVQSGYWVLLPPADSADAAAASVRELKARGLTDVMQMTKGDARNAVSLGIYRYNETARERMAQVRALGFNAQIEPRYDFKRFYWLRFKTADVEGVQPMWRGVLAEYKELEYKKLKCE